MVQIFSVVMYDQFNIKLALRESQSTEEHKSQKEALRESQSTEEHNLRRKL